MSPLAVTSPHEKDRVRYRLIRVMSKVPTAIIAISFSVVRTSAFCDYQKQETFENGYEQAIEDAVLVSSNEVGYILSFNGELHSYTFD